MHGETVKSGPPVWQLDVGLSTFP